MFIQSVTTYDNNQIIPIILGITIFELFRRIKLPSNSIINFLGASTFMVYLLHDNEIVYNIWNAQDWITLLYKNTFSFVTMYLIQVLVAFLAGLVCYCIYVFIGKLLNIFKPLVIKQSGDING